jgi:hypothetical protein
MKRILILTVAISLAGFSFSLRKTPSHWGLQVEDHLFIDQKPIAFIWYKEFLFYLKNTREDISAFWANHPDSLQLVKRYSGFDQYYVFHNPQFIDSAIVGLSHEKAEAYCRWRTEVVRERDKKNRQRVRYSLPSPEDFKKVEALAANLKEKKSWAHLFDGPPELTNVPGYVWVKDKSGGRLVKASEVPAHEITFRCKAEIVEGIQTMY